MVQFIRRDRYLAVTSVNFKSEEESPDLKRDFAVHGQHKLRELAVHKPSNIPNPKVMDSGKCKGNVPQKVAEMV